MMVVKKDLIPSAKHPDSSFPEEETEEKLLQYSQAFVTLANPIARAKYDDELNQLNVYCRAAN